MVALSPAGVYYHLSDLLRASVRFDGESAPFGRLRDIGFQSTAAYPPATCVEVRAPSRRAVTLPWSAVAEFSPTQVVVRRVDGGPRAPVDFWARRDILDDQVLDLSGAKVRRVNDVHLLYAEGRLVPAHVEVGFRGILRRLGIERPVAALLRWLFDYAVRDSFVTWRHLEVLSPGGLRVPVARLRLAELHPAEMADILEQLGVRERQTLLNKMDAETAAEALEEADPDIQRTVLSEADPAQAADILEEMASTEAAEALREIAEGDAERIISRMESEAAEDVRLLLAQEERSAGGVMTTACIEARPGQSAAAVLDAIRPVAEEVVVFNLAYVLDEARRLIGIVSLRELLRADPDTPVDALMTTHLITVQPDTSLHDLGRLFAKYGFRAVPVVDEQNVFLGAVRLKDVLEELAPLLRE